MHSRDIIFLVVGVAIGVVGILGTIIWSTKVGILALLVLGVLVLGLVILQRRQLARIQQRTLSLLNSYRVADTPSKVADVPSKISESDPSTRRELAVSTKKIIGMLEAQRVALDILNGKAERALSQKGHSLE